MNPWNSCIIADGNGGYLLSFRADHFSANPGSMFQSRLGLAKLDANFNFVPGSVQLLEEGSRSRQDARLFRYNGALRVIYNDLPPFEHFRTMFMASLEENNGQWVLVDDGPLQPHPTRVEKNWSPFVYVDDLMQEHLLMSYSTSPHRVLKVFEADPYHFGDFAKCEGKLPWKWGGVRGGTPALRVGDEYISFFHSMFFDSVYKTRWYVFGAYTFDAKPPFCMKRISPEPIYFKEMFSALHIQPSYVPGRAVFPVGLELALYQERNVFIVSHGDSDAASKIAIFDKEKFLETLIPIK
jgi:hypothetical protein